MFDAFSRRNFSFIFTPKCSIQKEKDKGGNFRYVKCGGFTQIINIATKTPKSPKIPKSPKTQGYEQENQKSIYLQCCKKNKRQSRNNLN